VTNRRSDLIEIHVPCDSPSAMLRAKVRLSHLLPSLPRATQALHRLYAALLTLMNEVLGVARSGRRTRQRTKRASDRPTDRPTERAMQRSRDPQKERPNRNPRSVRLSVRHVACKGPPIAPPSLPPGSERHRLHHRLYAALPTLTGDVLWVARSDCRTEQPAKRASKRPTERAMHRSRDPQKERPN
jgi:hypothetical protein